MESKNKRLFKLDISNEDGKCVIEGDANKFTNLTKAAYDEFAALVLAEMLEIKLEIK